MTFTPRAFQSPAPRIEQADVPLATLQQQVAAIVTGQRNAQLLTEAADRTKSPSDRPAYQLDAWLVRHPNAPLAQIADYPVWAAEMTARENANREARARKETL
ncbi:hypothetical protein ABZ341_17985 [Streptomyces sp. NPDC006173]|uniref:hypothetical protein n=1 Tax=Streptomyces sp. NPDC006173 TaxID=3155349 RepID=UPI0033CD54FC